MAILLKIPRMRQLWPFTPGETGLLLMLAGFVVIYSLVGVLYVAPPPCAESFWRGQ